MSLYDWVQVVDNGNFQFLYSYKWVKRRPVSLRKTVRLKESFDSLQQEYFDVYGCPESLEQLAKMKIKLIRLRCRLIKTNQRHLITKILILEEDINKLKGDQSKKVSFGSVIAKAEADFSFSFDRHTTTMSQFYDRTHNK